MLIWRELLLTKSDVHLDFNVDKFQVRTGIVLLKERSRSGCAAAVVLDTCEPASAELSSVQERHQWTRMSPMESDQNG